MLVICCILLSFGVGRSTNHLFSVTKTVGDDVTLMCPRLTSEVKATLYWIRIVSGNWPEFLGGTFSFDYSDVIQTSHITAKQGPGTFTLEIRKTKLSDTGLYYCIKVYMLNMEFVNATFLKIKGPDADITDIIQLPPSGPLHPGDPVTLQCSVFSNSEKKTCPGSHRVFWFSTRADESYPNFIYAHGNSSKCERSPEASSPQKCIYDFSKNVSSSDAGSYYCAVATCGQILFGNGAKLDIKAFSMWDLQTANIALCLVCAALATSLIVMASLICIIKKKTCHCCNDVGTISGDQQSQQKVEDSVVYSAATFTCIKTNKVPQRRSRQAEEKSVYSDVSAS